MSILIGLIVIAGLWWLILRSVSEFRRLEDSAKRESLETRAYIFGTILTLFIGFFAVANQVAPYSPPYQRPADLQERDNWTRSLNEAAREITQGRAGPTR